MDSLKRILLYIFYGLLAYMPFHLFASRWLSLYTGGLGQWDAAKDIITVIGLCIAFTVAIKLKLFKDKFVLWFFCISATYGLTHVLFLIFNNDGLDLRSFIVATLFNGRIFAYLFIGLVVGLTHKIEWKKIVKIVLVVSTITCLFGLIQYIAPKDLMTHFGYSIERGAKPSFFIDDKPDFPRIMSTVRDPNSYGAYLIVPIMLLWVLLLRRRIQPKYALPLLGLHGVALLLTFSRGAWIGVVIAGMVATLRMYQNQIIPFLKRYLLVVILLVVSATIGWLLFRDTYVYKNVILHSDESTVMADPNELRVQLQKESIEKIKDNPTGYGPGTAGLISINNPKGTFLNENYYLQIGVEAGLLGLAVFMSLLVLVGLRLGTVSSAYGITLFSSFIAYLVISLLIHLWSNEAVAAQWWLLTGLVLAARQKRRPISSRF